MTLGSFAKVAEWCYPFLSLSNSLLVLLDPYLGDAFREFRTVAFCLVASAFRLIGVSREVAFPRDS